MFLAIDSKSQGVHVYDPFHTPQWPQMEAWSLTTDSGQRIIFSHAAQRPQAESQGEIKCPRPSDHSVNPMTPKSSRAVGNQEKPQSWSKRISKEESARIWAKSQRRTWQLQSSEEPQGRWGEDTGVSFLSQQSAAKYLITQERKRESQLTLVFLV